jgi:transposase
VRVREISDDEGNRLKRIVRHGSGSVVTWRRAQMVLWSAQGMSVAQIAWLAFTSEDRVRDVLHDFNADGFEALYSRYAGGHPPVFTLAQRREIKKIAKSALADHGLPFSRWSLAKLADFLVAEGVVEDISHEGLRELLRLPSEEGRLHTAIGEIGVSWCTRIRESRITWRFVLMCHSSLTESPCGA